MDDVRSPRPAPEPLWRDAVGRRLRQARHARGERLTDTARSAGVSPQYLSEMERGMKEPSSEMLAAVAGALELSLLDLTIGVATDLQQWTDGQRVEQLQAAGRMPGRSAAASAAARAATQGTYALVA